MPNHSPHLPRGFCAAADPIPAQAIHTPSDGLEAGEVTVPVWDGTMPAYRARPKDDRNLPVVLTDVGKMRAAIAEKGGEILVYPDAGHGFHADYRPHCHKASAQDGWGRMRDWFERCGVA